MEPFGFFRDNKMTTFNSAYETTATVGFSGAMAKTQVAIKQAAYSSETARYNNDAIMMIEGSGTYGESVPPFAHPVVFPLEIFSEKERPWVAIDVRPYGRFNRDTNTFVVTGNRIEYNLAIVRARLNLVWVEKDKEILRDISPMPVAVFCAWISENVQRRFALEPFEQFNLSILAGIYYYSLFHNETKLDDRDKVRIANAIARNLRCNLNDVLKIVDQIDVVPNLVAFCEQAGELVSPIRLKALNPAVLITIVGSTWQGTGNHRELLAVALEHPPTWIGILMAACSERYYHNTQLARICERFTKNDIGKNFMQSTTRMLEVTSR